MKNFISKVGRFALLQAVIFSGFFALQSTAFAEMPPLPKSMWEETVDDATMVKDARRDPNTYCVNCHGHLGHFKHEGKHFQKGVVSPNTGKPLDCTTCHGNISENHRKGVKDVMRFNAYGKAKKKELERTSIEQNQVCFACHTPDKLRASFWAHDTHAMKMSCINCHKLHPETEPMKAIEPKQRVKLCVDCHSRLQAHHAEKKAEQQKSEQAKDKQ